MSAGRSADPVTRPSGDDPGPAPARWPALAARGVGATLVLLPWLPPLLARVGSEGIAAWIDRLFVPFCHRIPERCLVVWGETMPLCSRCLGLVEGLGLGLLVARPMLSPRRLVTVVGAACALMAIEIATQELGWHPIFHPTRLISGLLVAYPIGAVAGALARGARIP